VLTNRISKVADRLVASNQTTFIKGRYILESVGTAHEIIHSVHKSKQQCFILKLDYEKAYDKVNWNFLLEVLEKRGLEKSGSCGLGKSCVGAVWESPSIMWRANSFK
jgi:hypothetical protein